MAYQTYTTEALVCGTWTKNTSDKSYLLFTKEAGMLYADARSVREEKSKQRYALQDFSHIRVSLVKGKQTWRIGSVESVTNHYRQADTKEARGSVVTLYRFLRRFYKGEDASPELFDYVVDAFLLAAKDMKERETVELIIKLHILAELGYVNKTTMPAEVLTPKLEFDKPLTKSTFERIEKLLETASDSSQL